MAALASHPAAAMMDEDSDTTAAMKLRCCCFWVPWPSRHHPPPSSELWQQFNSHEDRRRSSAAGGWFKSSLLKVREWSELVAGPRWKTFIRRFRNRTPRRGDGSGKFQYDPLSYALNFDEGPNEDDSDGGGDVDGGGGGRLHRGFSSRWVAPSRSTSVELSAAVAAASAGGASH